MPRRRTPSGSSAPSRGILLTLFLLASGCGGGEPGSATPTLPGPTAAEPAAVELSARTVTAYRGRTAMLTAAVKDGRGATLPGARVTWSSSDPTVASVDASGLVRAVAVGVAIVRATSGAAADSAHVTVQRVPVATVTVTGALSRADTLWVGDSAQLGATVRDADGAAVTDLPVTWAASDTTLVRLSAAGRLFARRAGAVVLRARADSVQGERVVQLALVPVASVAVRAPADTLVTGERQRLQASVRSITGTELTDRVVVWSVSDSGVARISPAGELEALQPGTVRVTATVGAGAGSVTVVVEASSMVRVPEPDQPATCSARCLYVDATRGADTNDGRTAATAYRTLQKAADNTAPGTTVLVMTGTYTTDGTRNPLNVRISGTAGAWIRFLAAPGQRPVIRIPDGPGAYAGIWLPGASYIEIAGFEIVGQNADITAAQAATGDEKRALLNHNCIYIDGIGYPGFEVELPHDIVVRNNELHGCSSAGVLVNVGDALTIAYNRIYDNGWWTVWGTSGINIYHPTDHPQGTVTAGYKNYVVGNVVHNNYNNKPWIGGQPPAIYDGNGIIFDDGLHAQAAIGRWDTRGVPYRGRTYVANNVVYRNGGRGIHVYSSAHVDVINNTAYDNLVSSSPYIHRGEITGQASIDVHIANNVAVNLRKPTDWRVGGLFRHNIWWTTTPQAGPGELFVDPLLANPAAFEFTPSAASPALRSGSSRLAPTLDVRGNPRPPGRIDRGAVQVTR